MPPARYDAQAGNSFAEAQAFVAGFGTSNLHYAQALSGSMTPTAGAPATRHTFVFDQVSVTVYRALSRTKRFLSIFRTEQ